MARKFSSTSVDTTLTAQLTSGATTATVADAVDLLGGVSLGAGDSFIVALSPDTANEEVVVITAVASNSLTITRGQAGTSAKLHESGTAVRHVLTSIELTDFEAIRTNYVDKTAINAKGDLLAGTANDTIGRQAVGTNGQFLAADSTTSTGLNWVDGITASSVSTLTNKTLTAPIINGATISTSNSRLAGIDQKTSNYTLVAGDANKLINVDSASNLTVTVPSGVFTAGDVIYITRTGTGTVTIAASGTTITSPDNQLKLRVRYSSGAIICTASNTFRVVGDLAV